MPLQLPVLHPVHISQNASAWQPKCNLFRKFGRLQNGCIFSWEAVVTFFSNRAFAREVLRKCFTETGQFFSKSWYQLVATQAHFQVAQRQSIDREGGRHCEIGWQLGGHKLVAAGSPASSRSDWTMSKCLQMMTVYIMYRPPGSLGYIKRGPFCTPDRCLTATFITAPMIFKNIGWRQEILKILLISLHYTVTFVFVLGVPHARQS